MRILAAQINPTIGDIKGNREKVIAALRRAKEKKIDIVLFPELVLTGYFPEDLLLDPSFIDAAEAQLEPIGTETVGLFAVVGFPRKNSSGKEKPLYNSAAIFADGKLLGYQNKWLLPTYDVFDERRYFEPGKEIDIWVYRGKRLGITICEDAWSEAVSLEGLSHYKRNPLSELKEKKAELILNISGSPYDFGKKEKRISVFQAAARSAGCPFVFCNQVGANDQIVFDGHSLYIDKRGEVVQVAKGFCEDDLIIDSSIELPPVTKEEDPIADLYSALVLGVGDYFHKQGFQKGLIGLSGGIDSALVACIAQRALGAENVLALSMPSRFSSKGSIDDSIELSKRLGIRMEIISIEPIFQQYLDLLAPFFEGKRFDETEENLQARIRGMILMAFSNQSGAIVLNTSNKTEMGMGYCTLYGDMAGGLGVLQDVSKLQVYRLALHTGVIPDPILQKAPSAELKENQTDADSLPPFEILDPILEDYIEKGLLPEEIALERKEPLQFVQKVVGTIHSAEYKRRQAPIGIRVTPKAFGKGRIVPIVQDWR